MTLLAVLIGSIAGILTAGAGAYVAVRKLSAEQAKTTAEAAASDATASEKVVDSALKLIEPYAEQVARHEAGLVSLRKRVTVLEAHVSTLEAKLVESDLPVPPRPY